MYTRMDKQSGQTELTVRQKDGCTITAHTQMCCTRRDLSFATQQCAREHCSSNRDTEGLVQKQQSKLTSYGLYVRVVTSTSE